MLKETGKTITLTDNQTDESFDFPILDGTIGPSVVDFRSFYAHTGMFTFDPGYTSTASCRSYLTYIDGDKGELAHCGYTIQDLTNTCKYMEVCYLLFNKRLPNAQQYNDFVAEFKQHMEISDHIKALFKTFTKDAHPMGMLMSAVAALSTEYHSQIDINDADNRRKMAMKIIAKIPTLSAMAYKKSVEQHCISPNADLTYAENFMHMLFSTPEHPVEINSDVATALDKIFILHADHEQNASTATMRSVTSSEANPFAAIASSIGSLWGPAHGGANESVLNMLNEIASPDNIDYYIARAKDKDDSFRLMGFGHRVYKELDPRAGVLKQSAHDVLKATDQVDNPLFDLAIKLESIATQDAYFVERKLFPNVDFYSGIILSAIGLPANMFTVLFAMSRCVGWTAQWLELMESPYFKIARPRQLFVGEINKHIK